MSRTLDDYSQYNLNQLYEVLRNGDLDGFPEKIAAIKRQIELKGGNPNIPPPDERRELKPLGWLWHNLTTGVQLESKILGTSVVKRVREFVFSPEVGLLGSGKLSLLTVGAIVCCQYSLIVALGIVWPALKSVTGTNEEQFIAKARFTLWSWELILAGLGIWLMNLALKSIPNRAGARAAILLAAGLAPVSSYVTSKLIDLYPVNPAHEYSGLAAVVLWYLTIPIHFYLPFVHITLWMRYSYPRSRF